MDENQLVQAAKDGDADAFATIYTTYHVRIFTLCYRLMADADDAHDLTQETFVKAGSALASLRPDTNLSARLHRIANNACLDVLRRRQRMRWLPWDGPAHDPMILSGKQGDPARMAAMNETNAQVIVVLGRMTTRHRRVLILRNYREMSCAEIGTEFGLSRSAIKSCLFRAREEFRRIFLELYGEVLVA